MTDLETIEEDLLEAGSANHCKGWAYGKNEDGQIEGVIILNDDEDHVKFLRTETGYIIDGDPYNKVIEYFTQQE